MKYAFGVDVGGTTVKLGGIVKFVLTLPDELTQPTKVVLTAPNVNVSVNIKDVTLSTDYEDNVILSVTGTEELDFY